MRLRCIKATIYLHLSRDKTFFVYGCNNACTEIQILYLQRPSSPGVCPFPQVRWSPNEGAKLTHKVHRFQICVLLYIPPYFICVPQILPVPELCWDRTQSRKLKFRYGARNRFQKPSLELSSQAT